MVAADITITLGGRPELDAEARRARALHAQQVLTDIGWLFDEHISDLNRDLLGTNPDEGAKRETIFQQIDAAAQLKGRLHRIIQIQKAEETVNGRKHRNEPAADAE